MIDNKRASLVIHDDHIFSLRIRFRSLIIIRSWSTIFILGFGNLAALDFQSRCMAGKTPSTARWGCLIAAIVTLVIGIPFAYLGSMTRYELCTVNTSGHKIQFVSHRVAFPSPTTIVSFTVQIRNMLNSLRTRARKFWVSRW